MNYFTLKRTARTIQGVFGVIVDKTGYPVCLTGERPDLNNQSDISCIPAGLYKCKKAMSPSRGYKVIWILDVKDREDIQGHIGNKPMVDSDGCILFGMGYGFWDGQPTVTDSTTAFNKLMAMADDDFELMIIDC